MTRENWIRAGLIFLIGFVIVDEYHTSRLRDSDSRSTITFTPTNIAEAPSSKWGVYPV